MELRFRLILGWGLEAGLGLEWVGGREWDWVGGSLGLGLGSGWGLRTVVGGGSCRVWGDPRIYTQLPLHCRHDQPAHGGGPGGGHSAGQRSGHPEAARPRPGHRGGAGGFVGGGGGVVRGAEGRWGPSLTPPCCPTPISPVPSRSAPSPRWTICWRATWASATPSWVRGEGGGCKEGGGAPPQRPERPGRWVWGEAGGWCLGRGVTEGWEPPR